MTSVPPKVLIMATKPNCPYCNAMKPVFNELVKEYAEVKNLQFGMYNVEDDNWELADRLGLEGVPGFAILSPDLQVAYEVNNDGVVEKPVLAGMIVNNLNKI